MGSVTANPIVTGTEQPVPGVGAFPWDWGPRCWGRGLTALPRVIS